jgi:hypothetical protein
MDVCEKATKNIAQPIFVEINPYRGKSSPKMWSISLILNKLPRVNNHRLDENSPKLVTLIQTMGPPPRVSLPRM